MNKYILTVYENDIYFKIYSIKERYILLLWLLNI